MNVSRYIFILFALGFIAALPYEAFAHKHIPFYVTYENEHGAEELQLQCEGPYLRDSGLIEVEPGADHAKFYSAEVNIFSPYGKWSCSICVPDQGGATSCFGPIIAKTDFHLKKDDDEVSLTMTKDSISADPSDDSDTITARATLGDDNTKPNRDRDTFSFQGTEGDNVFVTLEEDPEAGHVGEEATLILGNGVSTIETSTDALPIEIMAVLPSSGEYNLIVQHNGISKDVRFRGSYFLSIESASGEGQEIKPTSDVEQ